MATDYGKASERLSAFIKADVAFLSANARRFTVNLTANAAMVVQNASRYLTYQVLHPNGIKIVGAYAGFAITVPAQSGGAATLALGTLAKADGTTNTVIITAASVLSGYSAGIPVAQTLAGTNPTVITVGSFIVATVAANNNAVGTADVGFGITLLCEAIEATQISE